jgi:hypothetical protein
MRDILFFFLRINIALAGMAQVASPAREEFKKKKKASLGFC